MKKSMGRWAAALVLVAALSCSAPPQGPTNLPIAEVSRAVGPDDMFDINVMGEKDLPHEFQVQPDGSIDFPYIGRVQVSGLEPQEVVDLLRKKLEDAKILKDPQITLIVKQYNSLKVNVIGQVAHQDNVPWTPGMTLLLAVTHSGGFTPMADSGHVILIRHVSKDKAVKAIVSVDAIMHNSLPDVPLQPGDTVIVEQRVSDVCGGAGGLGVLHMSDHNRDRAPSIRDRAVTQSYGSNRLPVIARLWILLAHRITCDRAPSNRSRLPAHTGSCAYPFDRSREPNGRDASSG